MEFYRRLIFFVLLVFVLSVGFASATVNQSTLLYIPGNSTYADYSTHSHSMSYGGVNPTINTTTKYFGAGSIYFNGGGYLYTANSGDGLPLTQGISQTISWWMKTSSTSNMAVVGTRSGDMSSDIYWSVFTYNNKLAFGASTGSGTWLNLLSGSTTVDDNNWHYCELVYNAGSNTVTIYIDGVQDQTGSPSGTLAQGSNLQFGYFPGSTLAHYAGYIDDLIITTGTRTGTIVQDTEYFTNPLANFTSNVTSGYSPLSVGFVNTSTGNIATTTYQWSYTNSSSTGGNGTQIFWSNLASPAAILTVGNWSINETITNPFGESTALSWVNVSPGSPPIANFTYSPTSGPSPLTVDFTDTSVSSINAWNWTFGSGNFSSLQNPSYTFIGAGNYSVTLQVTNASGTNTTVKYVNALSITDPNPNSMLQYKVGTSGVQINNQTPYVGTGTARNITSNTTEMVVNMTWDTSHVAVNNIRANLSVANITGLGIASDVHNGYAIVTLTKASGFTATANALYDFNITYVKYAEPGTVDVFSFDKATSKYYDVGNSTYWGFNYINSANAIIGVWGPINASFLASPTLVGMGSGVTFTDSSTGYPDAWLWDFGDGSTSSLQNPVYAYGAVGNYTITETAYMSENASVTNTTVKVNYIDVRNAQPPTAAFTASPTNVTLGSPVTFTDLSAGGPTSWSWAFGDGSGSSAQNPTHTYTSLGNYTVNLTVTNFLGSNTLSRTNYISVKAVSAPVASFTNNVSSGQAPLAVQFTDTSANTPTSWVWTFGDDMSISTLQNPTHTFNSVGNWSVSLKASNAAGNSTVTNYIQATVLSGFNRQDLYMDPEYTLTINFVDSVTNLPIPVVTVINAADVNSSVNTTTGTYVGTFGYGTVVLYCYSDGYNAKAVSYVITGNRVETVQLTKTTSTTSSSTTWYTPKTTSFLIVDVYGNRLEGATMNAQYNSTTLPNGLVDLINTYGMNIIAANNALNGTLIMNGTTDSLGSVVFTMMSTLKYDIAVSYGGNTNTYSFYPQESSYQLKFIFPVATDNIWNDLYANGNTKVWATEPDIGNVTFWWSFQDMTALTTRIDFYLKDVDLNTTVYQTNVTSPVAGSIYQLNYTVLNERGKNYIAWENYTRSV